MVGIKSRVNWWAQRSGQKLTRFIGRGLGTTTLGPPRANAQRLLIGILGMVFLLVLGLTVFGDIDTREDLMSACEVWKVRTLDCMRVNTEYVSRVYKNELITSSELPHSRTS